MYDTNERVAQVKERAARIKQKKEKRMIRGLSTLCLALCCCLVGILGEVSGGFEVVIAISFGEIAVSPRKTVLGQAFDFEVHGLRCRRGTQNKPGGEEKCYKSLHVTFLD